jgi:hypothetical protein
MPKKKLEVDDIDVDSIPRDKIGRRNPKRPNQTNRMASAEKVGTHLNALEKIPQEAMDNPVEWASKHLEKQIPLAAKELEWQLKFGDAKTRREIALETLAFKGISNRGPNTGQVVPAIQLIMSGPLPWTQVALPANQSPKLVEGLIIEKEVKDKE